MKSVNVAAAAWLAVIFSFFVGAPAKAHPDQKSDPSAGSGDALNPSSERATRKPTAAPRDGEAIISLLAERGEAAWAFQPPPRATR